MVKVSDNKQVHTMIRCVHQYEMFREEMSRGYFSSLTANREP